MLVLLKHHFLWTENSESETSTLEVDLVPGTVII